MELSCSKSFKRGTYLDVRDRCDTLRCLIFKFGISSCKIVIGRGRNLEVVSTMGVFRSNFQAWREALIVGDIFGRKGGINLLVNNRSYSLKLEHWYDSRSCHL